MTATPGERIGGWLIAPLAWLLVRYTNRALRWLHSLIDIPYTLPGVVLAIVCI